MATRRRWECKRRLSKKYSIAVIEDNPTDILLLRMALDKVELEYEIREITEGPGALPSLSQADPPPDLIVTDGFVPGMDLEELLSELKKIEPMKSVPVIVMTGMQDSQFERRVKEKGAADYIVKPGNLEGWRKVGERIKHMLEKAKRADGAA